MCLLLLLAVALGNMHSCFNIVDDVTAAIAQMLNQLADASTGLCSQSPFVVAGFSVLSH